MPTEAEMLISTRLRVLWTQDELRAVNRAHKILAAHTDRLQMSCGNELCPDQLITMHKADDRGKRVLVLRCGCTDRVLSRTI